jgi:hypothetical protein
MENAAMTATGVTAKDWGNPDRGAVFLLRGEAVVGLAAAVWAYGWAGQGWWVFAALFLLPDLSMLGYLLGPRAGAAVYNAGHWTVLPAALAAGGWAFGAPLAVSAGLIWIAHITFDRALGYGLKLPTGFGQTHLGRIGRGGLRA